MLRLVWKEIRGSIWVWALAHVMAVALVLLGDPLFFRGDSISDRSSWLAIPFFILGLKAYSDELGQDTVQFLFSRPIAWWRIWVAKLLAGVLGGVSTISLSLLVYALAAPEQYRPFIGSMWPYGSLEGFGLIMIACFVGFVVSVMMPGIALSFAALVAILIMIVLPVGLIQDVGAHFHSAGLQRFAASAMSNTVLLATLASVISSVLIARRLAKLGMKERWLAWARLPALGLALGLCLAAFGISLAPSSSDRKPYAFELSRDARWAAYYGSDLTLINCRTGKAVWTSSRYTAISANSWSPRSDKFACLTSDYQLIVVHPRQRFAWARTVDVRGLAERPDSGGNIHFSLLWNPDNTRVAVLRSTWFENGRPSLRSLAVVDTRRCRVRVLGPRQLKELTIEQAIAKPPGLPVLLSDGILFWPPGLPLAPVRDGKTPVMPHERMLPWGFQRHGEIGDVGRSFGAASVLGV